MKSERRAVIWTVQFVTRAACSTRRERDTPQRTRLAATKLNTDFTSDRIKLTHGVELTRSMARGGRGAWAPRSSAILTLGLGRLGGRLHRGEIVGRRLGASRISRRLGRRRRQTLRLAGRGRIGRAE